MSTFTMVTMEQDQIVTRIDAIIRELEALRRQLTVSDKVLSDRGFTAELFGAAGHGTREEYDPLVEWTRFSF